MKTLYKFKALVATKVRNEEGNKVKVAKGREFTTTEGFAKTYRSYKRMFQELGAVSAEVKEKKTTSKNSDAFAVTISDDMTNAQIEKVLSDMGAKFKKKDKRANLLKALEERKAELNEEALAKIVEEETAIFCKMVDGKSIDDLQAMADDMDTALDVENIDKDVCEEYITDTLAEKIEEAGAKKDGDEDGNSEGSLDGEGSEGSLDGADAGETSDK
jgi:ribosomal protein L20A (L18A)